MTHLYTRRILSYFFYCYYYDVFLFFVFFLSLMSYYFPKIQQKKRNEQETRIKKIKGNCTKNIDLFASCVS